MALALILSETLGPKVDRNKKELLGGLKLFENCQNGHFMVSGHSEFEMFGGNQ